MRTFADTVAARERVPLWVGLTGPSGSGKTFSALRVASGISKVTGQEIYYIDTEARRALHYADAFRFRHVDFPAPFGSLDYLAAVQHCVGKGAGVVVIDSMSHEHEGDGGYLQYQESEVQRMAGDNHAKRERVKMAAWVKPSQMRQRMISGLLQLNANLIFCFRAKEKTKPVSVNDKTEIVELGFQPIAGDALFYEMSLSIMLQPRAGGVPSWESQLVGERQVMKLPVQFEPLFKDQRPLDETHGAALAEWARGGQAPPQPVVSSDAPSVPAIAADHNMPLEHAAEIDRMLQAATEQGMGALQKAWTRLHPAEKAAFKERLDKWYKQRAA